MTSYAEVDFIKSSAFSSPKLGHGNDQGFSRKKAEHVDYRLRLSPERAANRVDRYRNRRVRRTEVKHEGGRAEQFYRELKKKGVRVQVGMEATGHSRWFERLLGELNYELWIGDAAQVRAKQVRKQKTDRRDAQHLLQLMLENNFPRIWVPTAENRDVRQLILHRHRLVGMRTRVMNQLQAIAMNEGIRRKRGLWSKKGRAQLESWRLLPWTSRRQELLELLDRFDPSIEQLGEAIEQEAKRVPEVQRLQTHPGVGPITALAFVLVLGTPDRFHCGKPVASYLGLIPCEDSSADRWRLGHITKQGNALLRFLLGQAAQSVAQVEEPWRHQYAHLAIRRNPAIAKVAMARRLAVRLFWMWRRQWNYQQLKKFGSYVG